jgi:serine/threonine kinase PknH
MSDAAPRVGSQFGPYLLKRLLGHGGMGEVYEAADTAMKRTVALKLISAEYSQDPEFRKRLQREARIAGRLREPHVVPIHDYGDIDGQLYVDMHFIEGTDLDTVLRRHGPLAVPRAVAIMRQIASALDAAHRAGVLHRDVKPANVLLTGDDFAYLVDFGVASAVTEEKLTQLGDVLGTWAYMAPERLRNIDVSHRADIYALACVLYECLTGSPPYPTGDRVALITAHLTAPTPRPSQQRTGIPVAFDAVIARGMAKSPENRYASAGDLALAANDALAATDQDKAADILRRSQAATMPAAGSTPLNAPTLTGASVPPTTPWSTPTQSPDTGYPHPPPYPSGGSWPGQPATPPSPGALGRPPIFDQAPSAPALAREGHTPWIWVSVAALVVVAILGGLGIWRATQPTPTTSAGEPKTSSTTTATATTPTQTTTATGTPNTSDVSRLIGLMPPGYRCESENPPFPNALASAGCDVHVLGGSPSISGLIYSLYADGAVLKSEFYNLIQGDKIVPCPGATSAPSDWHKAANPSVVVGLVGCGTHMGSPEVVWTNVYNNLLGIAQGDNLDQVYKWWQKNS